VVVVNVELTTNHQLPTTNHQQLAPALVRGTISPHTTHSYSRGTFRMAKQAVAARTDLDPIDRLEEKVRTLVSIVTQLRADHARAAEENSRLVRELDHMRSRVAAESEATGSELTRCGKNAT
jgi:hypothetical protein